MVRIEALIAWGSLAGFVLLMVLVALALSWGVPDAVACVEPETESHTPAMSVEVTSNRNGRVAEHDLFGCTFYSYQPPRGG